MKTMFSWFKGFSAFILSFSLASCAGPVMKNLSKQLPLLEDNSEVIVYDIGDTIPKHSEVLGGIRFLTSLDWENAMEKAKKEARSAGGNGLEIQLHAYPQDSLRRFYPISAFILNVNDSIIPTEPAVFDKMDFNDYIVFKGGDTIHGSIVFESRNLIKLVHGYNRQGYRKTISSPKNNLLAYYIEDPKSLAKQERRRSRFFDIRFAIDCGISFRGDHQGFYGLSDMRYNIRNGFTAGAHYGFFHGKQSQIHFFAGSLGHAVPGYSGRQELYYQLDGGFDTPTKKNHIVVVFYSNYLFGYLSFKEEVDTGDPGYYTLSGGTFGIGGYWGFDCFVTEHLSIGASLGGVLGSPIHAQIIMNDGDQYLKLIYPSHFDLTAGIRYYL